MHVKDFATSFLTGGRTLSVLFQIKISLFSRQAKTEVRALVSRKVGVNNNNNNKPAPIRREARFSSSVSLANGRESIENMAQFRFKLNLIFHALTVLVIHSNARYAAAAAATQNKGELLTVNITMKDFQTSTVCMP